MYYLCCPWCKEDFRSALWLDHSPRALMKGGWGWKGDQFGKCCRGGCRRCFSFVPRFFLGWRFLKSILEIRSDQICTLTLIAVHGPRWKGAGAEKVISLANVAVAVAAVVSVFVPRFVLGWLFLKSILVRRVFLVWLVIWLGYPVTLVTDTQASNDSADMITVRKPRRDAGYKDARNATVRTSSHTSRTFCIYVL